MAPLDRALVSSYRLSIVTMSLSAAVWPQFATKEFRGVAGSLDYIGSYVNKQVTTFYISGAGNNMFETSYSDSYGRRLRVCTMSTVG